MRTISSTSFSASPISLELLEDVAHEDDVDRIKPRHRLVEDHDLGIVEQGADELHLLLVPLGELLELAGPLVPEVEALEPRLGAHPGHGGPLPLDLGQEKELIQNTHLAVQAALLWEVADPVAYGGRVRGAQQLDDPGVGQEDPVDHAQRCRLPRTVAAEQARDRAARDRERQSVHRADLTEGLGHLSHPENGVSTHASPPQRNCGTAREGAGRCSVYGQDSRLVSGGDRSRGGAHSPWRNMPWRRMSAVSRITASLSMPKWFGTPNRISTAK
jgi:hypothetical protein